MKRIFFLLIAGLSRAEAAPTGCRTLSVFFGISDSADCPHPLGHAGMAVDNEYFDFGSQKKPSIVKKFFGTEGGPYWGREFSHDPRRLATAAEVREGLRNDTCATFEFRARISEDEAQLVRDFWRDFYSHEQRYHLFGTQCTTTVSAALHRATLLPAESGALAPRKLFFVVLQQLRSTCGANAGQRARGWRLDR